MKRDWELIKELLLRIECLEFGRHYVPQALAEHTTEAVKYHLHLLHQAGLVECSLDESWDGTPEWVAHHLTLHGHDLLDEIRHSDARHSHKPLLREAPRSGREELRQSA